MSQENTKKERLPLWKMLYLFKKRVLNQDASIKGMQRAGAFTKKKKVDPSPARGAAKGARPNTWYKKQRMIRERV